MQCQYRIHDYPDVNFTVVINPGSGPGPSPLPDTNYTREIPKLTASPNVRALGYVSTAYATRDQEMVLKDVETYANWPKKSANGGLAVQGIFFDEIPQNYSASAAEYLQKLTASVKKLPGLGPDNFVCILSYFHVPFFLFIFFSFYSSFPVPHLAPSIVACRLTSALYKLYAILWPFTVAFLFGSVPMPHGLTLAKTAIPPIRVWYSDL